MAKEKFNELDFLREALTDMFGDDEDAIEAEIENYQTYGGKILPLWEWNQVSGTGFASVGSPDYWEKQKFEGKYMLAKIPTMVNIPSDCRLRWTGFPHDFGTYYEIELWMDSEDSKHWECFNKLEQLDWEGMEIELNELWDNNKQLEIDNEGFSLIH